MAGTSTQNNQNSGTGQNQGQVAFRDANASIGGIELPITLDNSAKSSATGGWGYVGDTISGGGKVGTLKLILFVVGGYFLIKAWKRG